MSKFLIRDATRNDAHAIATIHLDARREAMPWLPVLHDLADAVGYFRDVVLANEVVLVAEIDGRVIGFIAIERDFVDHLYVAPGHQGLGIGDALLKRAKQLHPSGLKLWTFQRNLAARKFYEQRGFVAREFTDGSRNEEREPDVMYEWNPGAKTT
jgi:GNAT superfamily N-acetyltransferase